MKPQNLLSELKRRNVIRFAGLYLVGAWLVVQVTGTLLPMFEAPAWWRASWCSCSQVGVMPALIFAWAFELTPPFGAPSWTLPPSASRSGRF